jgi:hypothetical protein
MHYLNGRKAVEGDPVIYRHQWCNISYAGVIHSFNARAETCNALMAVPQFGGCQNLSVTIRECIHAEDAFQAAKDSLPRRVEQTAIAFGSLR